MSLAEPPQVFFGPAGPHRIFTLAQVLCTLAEVIVLDVLRLQLWQYIRLCTIVHRVGILGCGPELCPDILSSQQYFTDTGNPSKASLTFDKRFTAMWPDTNTNRGIVNSFFASLALEATSPWLTPFSCTTTVYTAGATPFPLASPEVAWMSF